jgi:acetyl esterase/lipase
VSGIAIVPSSPPPAGGRDVVAWAHPTTGVARRCAPSLSPFGIGWIPDLEGLLARGYIVTATDYPGLGTRGPHPYLVGVSEGRAVLDSARAVRALPDSHAGNRIALWGHSQGGHAVLFAGHIARTYAPELRLVGIAAAAPATALLALIKADIGTLQGKVILAMTLVSWSQVFRIPLTTVIAPGAVASTELVARDCVETFFDLFYVAAAGYALQQRFLITDPTTVQPWRSLAMLNSPGAPNGVPVLLVQGTADDVVEPVLTERYAATLCRHGSVMAYLSLPGVSHTMTARAGAADIVRWIAGRFDGVPAPNNCRPLIDTALQNR